MSYAAQVILCGLVCWCTVCETLCTTGDVTSKEAAFDACAGDVVCSKLFQLDNGGTEKTFWNQVLVHNGGDAPASGECMLQAFIDLPSDAEKEKSILVNYLITTGTEIPPCPYDMVYVIDELTGGKECVCPMGVSCRPPCNDKTIWINTCIASAAIFGIVFTLRLILTGARSENVKSE
jgi:hypothetical protein